LLIGIEQWLFDEVVPLQIWQGVRATITPKIKTIRLSNLMALYMFKAYTHSRRKIKPGLKGVLINGVFKDKG
jgi:hypothetical protein